MRNEGLKKLCCTLFIQFIPRVGRVPKVQLLLDHFQYLRLPEVLELADPVARTLLSVFPGIFHPTGKHPRNARATRVVTSAEELGTNV